MTDTEPYPYQEEGIAFVQKTNWKTLIADEMGLGKTLQALLAIKRHLKPGPVVVVCPAHAKETWRREAARHVGIRAEVLSGRKCPKSVPVAKPRLYVINYDILHNWGPWLRALKPVAVVGDEIQYIKNLDTIRFRAFQRLCLRTKKIIGLSGTPIENCPAEFFPFLSVLHPDKFNSFLSFAFEYCEPEKKPWGQWEYKGARNTAKLHKKLTKLCMIRRLKKDVFPQMPKMNQVIVPIKLRPQDMREYKRAETDLIRWLQKNHPGKAKRAARAKRLVQFGYLLRLVGQLKVRPVMEWIDGFGQETDEKLLVFANHTGVIQSYHDRYKGSVMVTGKLNYKEKQLRFDAFNRQKKVRFMFGNLKAAGSAWSCTSTGKVAFAELGLVPGQHTQAAARVHGLKRGIEGEPSFAYYLVVEGTIEEKLCRILQKKQKDLDEVLDGGRPTGGLDNLLDELEVSLNRKAKKG